MIINHEVASDDREAADSKESEEPEHAEPAEPERAESASEPSETAATGGDADDAAAEEPGAEAAAGAEKSEDDANADSSEGGKAKDGELESERAERADKGGKGDKRGSGGRWWVVLLVILVVEMYVYGRNAEIEVCVGKEGAHDFSLVGTERTDENRWKFPRCEARLNLGLRSHFDEQVDQAVLEACRGATMFRNRGEGKACVEGTDGWQHRIDTHYVWPWDSRFYEHLFWFLQ